MISTCKFAQCRNPEDHTKSIHCRGNLLLFLFRNLELLVSNLDLTSGLFEVIPRVTLGVKLSWT